MMQWVLSGLTYVRINQCQVLVKEAMEGLATQTADLLNAREVQKGSFSRQIAFNVIPQIDAFMDNDYTKEEMKMVWETRKILGDDTILVNPTAVRVPVFYGHGEAIHIENAFADRCTRSESIISCSPWC